MSFPGINRTFAGALAWAIICEFILCLNISKLAGADDAEHWIVKKHEHGREVSFATIPGDSELNKEIESLKKKCVKKAVADLNTYAPSFQLERKLEKIDIRSKKVVYSTRRTVDAVWVQKSRKADVDDEALRERLLQFRNEKDADE